MTRTASLSGAAAIGSVVLLALLPGSADAQIPPPPITEFEFITIECSDGLDNDGDGRVDFGEDPGCVDAQDEAERRPTRGARARFRPLRLPRDAEEVIAADVSRHGRVIVGVLRGSVPGEPFLQSLGSVVWKWGRPRLIEDLRPQVSEGFLGFSEATSVSDDGRLVGGSRVQDDEPSFRRAYLWKRGDFMDLDADPSEPFDSAFVTGIANSGVAVGSANSRAVRWENGTRTILNPLPDPCCDSEGALAITPDEAFTAGGSLLQLLPPSPEQPDGAIELVATLWEGDDIQGTAVPPFDDFERFTGLSRSRAMDVSDDGENSVGNVSVSFLYGRSQTSFAFRARAGGTRFYGRDIGDRFFRPSIELRSLAADGSLAVGAAEGVGPIVLDGSRLRSLVDLLENEYGVDLRGWDLTTGSFDATFTTISPDGRILVGNGTDPDGNFAPWWVRLPPVCSDGLDNDGDGDIDFPEDRDCRHRGSRSEAR